ncbi:CRISPR-associated protein Cas2 [Ammonifex degensii KC4]|uniref:CRISPR-associated endoribonuclease Cas2 n=1 Tax=Ammonifex degensii (strain DSM 10501 / KC4) TaxID=429009 RepID=C9R976_AMMDK|nr:CRISPR-associated endonuclease Cas2 [Ammonifex degensii]ACX52855.1 CRISPR-associated protein Cas2 [Ammonifex degensii KC4]
MKTLVVYDIPDDRVRAKVFETCKDYGLAHIQYSAFFGPLNQNRRQELCQRLRRILGNKEGKIIICPICDKDLALMLEIAVPEEAVCRVAELSKKGPIIY